MRETLTKISEVGRNMSEQEKEKQFFTCLNMVEVHHKMLGAKNLKQFLWQIHTNFPFPAYVYLLCALRNTPDGPHADRAWKLLSESFERRVDSELEKGVKESTNTLKLAMANLTIKAWEAREAQGNFNPAIPTPRFICHYRNMIARMKASNSGYTI